MTGDLKPSQFLARARARISKDDMSDSVLIEILVAKLPYEAHIALSTAVGMPLKDFSAAADAAVRRLPPTSFVSSVSQPSSINDEPSNFRNPTTISLEIAQLKQQMSQIMIAMNQPVSSRGTAGAPYQQQTSAGPNSYGNKPQFDSFPWLAPYGSTKPTSGYNPPSYRRARDDSSRPHDQDKGNKRWCFSHSRFGQRARKCIYPWAWQQENF